MSKIFQPPFDNDLLMRKQRGLKRELLAQNVSRIRKRIAILGGSTTAEIKNMLEIFLLDAGIEAKFFESEYDKYYEDAVFDNEELNAFQPEIIIIFTSFVNLKFQPKLTDTKEIFSRKLESEYERFKTIWDSLFKKYNAVIIQNNFDLPHTQPEGSAEFIFGLGRFINILNEKFFSYAENHSGFYIHDINRLAAQIGLSRWHDRNQYYNYKLAVNYDFIPSVAFSLLRIICSILGRVKKCLVLDLDNTLWGGIIGDDGVNGISIGRETPQGEAFTEFQEYCKSLKERGIILAVCSKNDLDIAKSGFTHPDSVLKFEDFSAFYANWEPKNVNIMRIAQELNIGLDSLVFIDDNPAERAIVRESLPEVSVPEVDPENIFSYINAIEENGFFDMINISEDDLKRSETYRQNSQRAQLEHMTANYDEFLKSLEMTAEIGPFKEIYFDRITQLTNKSNQFNLTTRRFTLAEIRAMSGDENFITLYCRLRDKFGDNGVISLMIGERDKDNPENLNIILWLMSCRVLKRGVENLMINSLVDAAKKSGYKKLAGFYYKTKKNGMTADLYKNFGFALTGQNGEDTTWEKSLDDFAPAENFISVINDGGNF